VSKSKVDLRKLYLEYNYPSIATYENLLENYINKEKSLPDIYKEYGMDYKSTQFLLDLYKIPKRGYTEGSLSSMKKREETNLEKYGSKNVLSKGTINYEKRNRTVKEKYGVDNVFQIKEVIEKINDNNYYLEKYGMNLSEYRSNNHVKFWGSLRDEEKILFIDRCNEIKRETIVSKYGSADNFYHNIQEKIKKLNRDKYECDYFFQSREFLESESIKEKSKETKIKNGYMMSDVDMEPFLLYKRNCRKLTNITKKELYEKWDGYDYYDNEFIRNNLNLHNTNKNYPTIDHKTSIFYGFINKIDEREICDIKNLCITKRSINCSKRQKNYYEKL
jgi:hypothetical protein